ncbi:MAG: hypothetical protein CMA63_06760 [Euryarchaeota archaeon]|nr:hypothetical protein [Euryarchaeota archaeon]
MKARRLLILGGSGRLGRRLKTSLPKGNATAFFPSRADLDALSAQDLSMFLVEHSIDRCVCLAAATDVARCERDLEYASINPQIASVVSRVCTDHLVESVYISTDYVVPLLLNESANVYASSKLVAEPLALQHGSNVLRVAFTTPEQSSAWSFVNSYTRSNRAWVEDTAKALSGYILRDELSPIASLCPPETTFEDLLRARFPHHKALDCTVWSPEDMKARVGVAAPSSTCFNRVHDHEIVKHSVTKCWQ